MRYPNGRRQSIQSGGSGLRSGRRASITRDSLVQPRRAEETTRLSAVETMLGALLVAKPSEKTPPVLRRNTRRRSITIQPSLTPSSHAAAGPNRTLRELVAGGDIAAAKRMLVAGVDPNDRTNSASTPMLIDLAWSGDLPMVELIIAHGAHVNAKTQRLNTALHVAYERGWRDVADALIAAGANEKAKNNVGKTPKQCIRKDGWRCGSNDPRLASQRQHGGRAPASGVSDDVRAKWSERKHRNSQPRVTGVNRRTSEFLDPLLHGMCKEGNVAMAQELLEEGASINSRDKGGATPLCHCIWDGHFELATLLIANGADVSIATMRLNTPLHFAFERGWRKIADALIAAGSNTKARNSLGKTPKQLMRKEGWQTDPSLEVRAQSIGARIVAQELEAARVAKETQRLAVERRNAIAETLTRTEEKKQLDRVQRGKRKNSKKRRASMSELGGKRWNESKAKHGTLCIQWFTSPCFTFPPHPVRAPPLHCPTGFFC